MIDTTLYYPQKLGRFNNGSCIDIYYSEPYGRGVYYNIEKDVTANIGYIRFILSVNNFIGYITADSIFSSGIMSGIVISASIEQGEGTITIEINKDSFVTDTDLTNFIDTHSGIYYNFEILKFYNEDAGYLKNAVLNNVIVNSKQRVNNYSYYSPHDFVYNKDFYYDIEIKNVTLRDLYQVDDLFRASAFVLKSRDSSTLRSGALDDLPNVIGITGYSSDIMAQPYYGGLQNNEWYRATLINDTIKWENGRYKGKLTFRVKG